MQLLGKQRLSLLYGGTALAAFLWLIWIWWSGHLTAINFFVVLGSSVSLGFLSILQRSGDVTCHLDEGQRAASLQAQSNAFYVGYFGVFGLWMGYLTFPAWKADVTIHLGVLFFLLLLAYFGTLTWLRWRNA